MSSVRLKYFEHFQKTIKSPEGAAEKLANAMYRCPQAPQPVL
jgi:hypothetical protein